MQQFKGSFLEFFDSNDGGAVFLRIACPVVIVGFFQNEDSFTGLWPKHKSTFYGLFEQFL